MGHHSDSVEPGTFPTLSAGQHGDDGSLTVELASKLDMVHYGHNEVAHSNIFGSCGDAYRHNLLSLEQQFVMGGPGAPGLNRPGPPVETWWSGPWRSPWDQNSRFTPCSSSKRSSAAILGNLLFVSLHSQRTCTEVANCPQWGHFKCCSPSATFVKMAP